MGDAVTSAKYYFLLAAVFAIPASEPWTAMVISWILMCVGFLCWCLEEKATEEDEERKRVLDDCLDHLMGAMAKIAQPAHASCGCRPVCSCNSPESEAINADAMRDIAAESIKYVEQYYEPE